MARQRGPAKPLPVEQPTSLHRIARVVSDWKVIITAVLLLFGGVAFALSYKFATKAELATVQEHLSGHDIEFAGFRQALEDIRETVHQIHDDQRLQSSPHR